MTTQTAALKLALEALYRNNDFLLDYHLCESNNEHELQKYDFTKAENIRAITAIKEALAQPEQEPYCWTWDEFVSGGRWRAEYGWEKPERQVTNLQPLYTHPPQPKEPEQEHIDYEKLAALGWQAIECSICGSSARAFPKPEHELLAIQYASRAERDLYEMEDEDDTTPPQRKPLTDEDLVRGAQSCLSPSQYDHFEALLEDDPDAHSRLTRAIEWHYRKRS